MSVKRCHQFGGKTAAGKPCNRPVTDDRPCPSHRPEADATMQAKKKKILELLEVATESLVSAAAAVKVDPATVWRWRQSDRDFDKAYLEAQEASDRGRVKIVEDTLFKRLATGKASPTEMVFYLMNRAPDRWKDKRNLVHTGPDDNPLTFTLNIENGNGNGNGGV